MLNILQLNINPDSNKTTISVQGNTGKIHISIVSSFYFVIQEMQRILKTTHCRCSNSLAKQRKVIDQLDQERRLWYRRACTIRGDFSRENPNHILGTIKNHQQFSKLSIFINNFQVNVLNRSEQFTDIIFITLPATGELIEFALFNTVEKALFLSLAILMRLYKLFFQAKV